MATQASLDITTGDVSSAAWADTVTSHLPTIETATPATVFEGKQWVRSDLDRVYTRDGSSNNVLTGHYSASGRPWAKLAHNAATLSVPTINTVQSIPWSATDDPDAATTQASVWDGSQYRAYIAPVSGLYAISWFMEFTTQASTNDKQWWVACYTSSGGYKQIGHGQPKAGILGQGAFIAPLIATEHVRLSCYYEESTARTLAGTSYLVIHRLCA